MGHSLPDDDDVEQRQQHSEEKPTGTSSRSCFLVSVRTTAGSETEQLAHPHKELSVNRVMHGGSELVTRECD